MMDHHQLYRGAHYSLSQDSQRLSVNLTDS